MNSEGKLGCGCLIGILVILMVLTGALFHPLSLRFMAKQFRYEDKIVTADAIFVPRFTEDRKGELYVEAFREYFSGNGKVIYIEDDKVLGTDIHDLVSRMAKARGIKDTALKAVEPADSGAEKTAALKAKLQASGARKIIVVVPEYASRRYYGLYDPTRDGGAVLYIIKPVQVSYFKKDGWWKDEISRSVMAREFYISLMYCYSLLGKKNTKQP